MQMRRELEHDPLGHLGLQDPAAVFETLEGRLLLRRRQPIYDGGISTLRRFKDDVKEVRNGFECGIKLGDYDEYEVGDIIEAYTLEKVAQKLE